jgi:C4-type Zn-finger protein
LQYGAGVRDSYTREQRSQLEDALRQQRELRCPVCHGAMSSQPVVPPTNVPYVRHRVWLMCKQCKRSVSLDEH